MLAQQAGALSIRELLGLEETDSRDTDQAVEQQQEQKEKPVTDDQNWAKPATTPARSELGFADIQQLFANIDSKQAQTYLADETSFRNFVIQQANNLSVLIAARDNNLDNDVNTAYLMQRGADNILRETYLNKLILSKIPSDFPTPEQTREYYDNNKDQFVLEERVHVWQIYLMSAFRSR